MSSLALDAFVSVELPTTSVADNRRNRRMSGGGNPAKFKSKRVRARNTGTTRPWRQHSGSFFRRKTPRSALLAQALHDDSDERALAPEEFWSLGHVKDYSGSAKEYVQIRASQEEVIVRARQDDILHGIEEEFAQRKVILEREESKLARLAEYLWRELIMAAREFYDELRSKLRYVSDELALIRNDLEIIAQMTA